MNAVINKVTYSGVFFLQHDESSDCKKVMTFTAIGTNNQSVWGVKKDAYKYTDKEILERAAGNLDADRPVISKTTSDTLTLSQMTEKLQDLKMIQKLHSLPL